MKKFLEKINATEKLMDDLKEAHLNVSYTNGTEVKLNIKPSKRVSAISNVEFISKTISKLIEQDFKLESINFEMDYSHDPIYVYENIITLLEEKYPAFEKRKFCLDINNDEIKIKTLDKETESFLVSIRNEIDKYLEWSSATNKNIIIEEDGETLGASLIEEQFEKEITSEVVVEKRLDDKLWPGYEKVEFTNPNPQKKVYFEGEVFGFVQSKARNTDTNIFNFGIGNAGDSIHVTAFDKATDKAKFKDGTLVRVYGNFEMDDFKGFQTLKTFRLDNVQILNHDSLSSVDGDETEYKRSEFHVHTKMSTLDGVSTVADYIKYAEAYNLAAITITDHNSAQSYPDAAKAQKNTDVQINYGVELDVYNDIETQIVINERDQELLTAEYVFFDLETTSLYPMFDEIIEFGAVKYKDNKVIDRLQMFIKPKQEITQNITNITSITNEDVQYAPRIEEAIHTIKEWMGDAILVAHNASFDYGFLNKAYLDNGLGEIKNPIIDTMKISWFIHPNSRSHALGQLCKYEEVRYDQEAAHRADYDAEVLSQAYERLLHKLLAIYDIRDLKTLNAKSKDLGNYIFTNHITLVSKNQRGLHDINQIISMANVEYFNSKRKTAMMPLSYFVNRKDNKLLDNLLIGSACLNGILMNSILNSNNDFIESIIHMFDYLEVFPVNGYKDQIVSDKISKANIKLLIKKVIELGKKHNIPVIASSNAHYTSENEKVFRDILISAPRVGAKSHPLLNYRNKKQENPDAHLWSTTKMIEHFSGFLSEEDTMDIVINNPALLQSKIEEQNPIKDKLYPPKIAAADKELEDDIKAMTIELYGDEPNELIQKRIDRELDSIIKHGFGIVYYLSQKAVQKSNEMGFLVGSRGSVGSSIAATLSGITEVNPLMPHYRCSKCKFHEFSDQADSGFDLPNRDCPVCGEKLIGDGHSIPFETFLGFNADKVPDIDLNFSRDNQSDIHKYMKDLLGEDKIFRAGTISTAAPKTAIGYVKKWQENQEIDLSKPQLEWLASKIEGAKRTSGQHPGGLIVIPDEFDVYDFTPINYPGDDSEAEWKTTHFDFHSIHDNLLKLDLLGHLDPSTIRMLQNLTNIDPKSIPMNDPEVISLFKNSKALKYENNLTGEDLGILGLPEFGTSFVRELVREAKPTSFADLVRISGLSHGTDVWTGNAQNLIKKGEAKLSEVISVRDDIMTYLIGKGLDESSSFNIMESVRKGFGLKPEWEKLMRENNVPEWYINSCKLIKYMFPKAHATAYVMMAYRIAWYKINYPLEYYATYFSKRDVELDLERILNGVDDMKRHQTEINSIPKKERVKKDDDLLETYNIILEMYSRGITFSNIDINRSQATDYIVDRTTGSIIPPFSILEGVGGSVADAAVEARKKGDYASRQDFKTRSKLPSKALLKMKHLNIFNNIAKDKEDTEQLNLFL